MKQSAAHLLSILMVFTCTISLIHGQTSGIREYGKVSPEEIENTGDQWPAESDAVVLFDLGAVSFDLISRTPKVKYTFHQRIKIINTQGSQKYSKIELSFLSPLKGETMTDLKAATYALNAVGDVVAFKVNPRKVKETRVGKDSIKVEIQFPFVKEGSVIEYSYDLVSRNFAQLKPWVFQSGLPVMYSEYQTFIPDGYKYLRMVQGFEGEITHFSSRFQQQAISTPDLFTRNMQFSSAAGNLNSRLYSGFSGTQDVYVMMDLPPIVSEAFSPETKDFLPGIRLELSEDFLSRTTKTLVFDNWGELAAYVTKRVRVKGKSDRAEMTRLARVATARINWEREKARAIYEYVRANFTWDNTYQIDNWNLSQTINRKEGSGAELNLQMLFMLRDAGFSAWPVLIRTRENGYLQTIYPTLSQFNHLLVSVLIGDKEVLLDAVGDTEVFGILPKNDLNELGYLVDDEGGRWVTLRDQNKIVRTTYSRFDLDQTGGELVGDISVINENYSAVLERGRIEQFKDNPDAYLRDFVLVGMKNPQIKSEEVQNEDNAGEQPLIINCEVSTRDFIQTAGDLLFLKPMMIKMVSENPFVEKKRQTPLDFTYPLRDSHMLGLRIPEGYEVAQLPQPIRVVLPNNGGSFTYNVLEMGKILHLTSTILLNKTTYSPNEYEAIRTFFDYVVNKHQEDVILRKIPVQP
ncbi:MAG: hypothetical protein R3C61_08855 [Bacteroidia bacterium]